MSEAKSALPFPDLLPLLLSFIDEDAARVREWCTWARVAFDRQRRCLVLRDCEDCAQAAYRRGAGVLLGPGKWDPIRSPDFLLSASRGFLGRGCRPLTVVLNQRFGSLEERRRFGASVLQAFADHGCGQPGGFSGPTILALDPALISPAMASSIASVFPALEELQLDFVSATWRDGLEGTRLLLGSAGQGGAPLLPRLVRVRLPDSRSPGLGAACVAALSGSATLRELEVALELGQPGVAQSLGGLTQLQALKLTVMGGDFELSRLPLLPSVLVPLVGLTRLSLSGYSLALPGAVLTVLTGLRQLEGCGLSLGMGGLEALRSLTSLTVETLLPPPGGAWGELLAAPAALWPLPPRLCSLWLCSGTQPIELLAALQRTSGITFTCGIPDDSEVFRGVIQYPEKPARPTLQVIRGHHTTRSGSLLAAGEAALCGAIRLLTAASASSIDITFEAHMSIEDHGHNVLLRPVAGADGPGGRHHSAWLAALTSTGLTELSLRAICLCQPDLFTIARCTPSLEDLSLPHPTSYPPHALPHLVAGLPDLQQLLLAPDPLVAAPRDGLSVLFRLLRSPRFGGEITVDDGEEIHEAGAERLAARLERRLARARLDPDRISWMCLPMTTESGSGSGDDVSDG